MKTEEVIKTRKRGKKTQFALFSKDGSKRLGPWGSKAAAIKRERQVQYFKHQKK